MQTQGTVEFANGPMGRLALRVADGSYVLAEQLDVQPLRAGQELSGEMDTVGTEVLTDRHAPLKYTVFIVAYGLSREAVEQELAA
jgi:hypothetical protein